MNVPLTLAKLELEAKFVKEIAKEKMAQLRGAQVSWRHESFNIQCYAFGWDDDVKSPTDKEIESPDALTVSSKVCWAIRQGFWTFVDMASGSYLWRNLVSSSTSCTGKRAD
ncbi:unnamed protein product [Fraxinus pennsylvanica]|uniref:Uncharacterized protein n=1 Tax=Fraxinus pennsylvanica TaxID=56036 RepID=A0AAD2E6D5_9LAMI|nr:unnamed protein product [Fraxinus pennsylvanica]